MTIKKINTAIVNPNVVFILEDLLKDAKKGELLAIAIAGSMDGGRTFNSFDGSYYPTALIGEMRVLEREIIDYHISTRKDEAQG